MFLCKSYWKDYICGATTIHTHFTQLLYLDFTVFGTHIPTLTCVKNLAQIPAPTRAPGSAPLFVWCSLSRQLRWAVVLAVLLEYGCFQSCSAKSLPDSHLGKEHSELLTHQWWCKMHTIAAFKILSANSLNLALIIKAFHLWCTSIQSSF